MPDIRYLSLLAREFPSVQAVSAEIIKLEAVRSLPKGTEHFMSDIHGEHEAFLHILNNASGAIMEKIDDLYETALTAEERRSLATLIYYPAETLHETIPLFHNTPNRYKQLREVLERDPLGRAKDVQEEIAFALAREEKAGQLIAMLEAGELPLRVTHNDTKLNNVMFRASDRTPLCVMDLDTTMPGLSAYDFGDAIRFGASTAAEDEKDLNLVRMDLELFRLFTKGFLEACPGLTDKEKEVLPLAAFTMTLECGTRFLTDYIDGDNYFSIHYPEQNLDRCHTQFKLVEDMEAKWDEMVAIVARNGKE